MSEEQKILEEVHRELVRVRHLLEIMVRDELKKALEQSLTTQERRKIYVIMDGLSGTEEIAQKAGVSQRSAQLLVKELLDSGLVSLERRGYPRRTFDYVPSEWRIQNVAGQ
jgi:DNA-binding transcriptional ArsR family regulator